MKFDGCKIKFPDKPRNEVMGQKQTVESSPFETTAKPNAELNIIAIGDQLSHKTQLLSTFSQYVSFIVSLISLTSMIHTYYFYRLDQLIVTARLSR